MTVIQVENPMVFCGFLDFQLSLFYTLSGLMPASKSKWNVLQKIYK